MRISARFVTHAKSVCSSIDSAFLPQDRVAEFARMTPQQLLRETQRAAGNENLTAWHDTLIGSGRELRTIQEVSSTTVCTVGVFTHIGTSGQLVNADRDQLKTMEERNANLERDVRRYEERAALEKRVGGNCRYTMCGRLPSSSFQIKLLELIVPFKEYYEARDVYRDLKPKKAEAVKNWKLLKRRNQPFVDMQKYSLC